MAKEECSTGAMQLQKMHNSSFRSQILEWFQCFMIKIFFFFLWKNDDDDTTT